MNYAKVSSINSQYMILNISLIVLAILILIAISKLNILIEEKQKIRDELLASNESLKELTTKSLKSSNFNILLTQYCLTCLKPYIIAIQNNAIKREDYEEAAECQKIIETITSLIKHSN